MAEDHDIPGDIPVTGAIRQKLVETKQAWARAGRLLTGVHGNPALDRLRAEAMAQRKVPLLVVEQERKEETHGIVAPWDGRGSVARFAGLAPPGKVLWRNG